MRKLPLGIVCLMLIASPLCLAAPTSYHRDTCFESSATGSFAGTIGYPAGGNWTAVGTLNGTYETRARGLRFGGDWDIDYGNTTAAGTMRGVSSRHILIGRVSAEGYNRTLPIVGFLRIDNGTFVGRFMAPVGPALYFRGTYT